MFGTIGRAAALVCLAVAGFAGRGAEAGELRETGDYEAVCGYRFEGPIEAGDAAKLESIERYGSAGVVLCFDSPGGVLLEGQKMFHFLWDAQVATRVMAGDECLSACAIAWLGGGFRLGSLAVQVPLHDVQAGGRLGFHAPSLGLSGRGAYPAALVNQAFATALEGAEGLYRIKLEERNGARPMNDFLYQQILRTPPEEMYVIDTVGRAMLTNTYVAGLALPDEITPEHVLHVCEHVFLRDVFGTRGELREMGEYVAAVTRWDGWGGIEGERVRRMGDDFWVVRLNASRSEQICVVSGLEEQVAEVREHRARNPERPMAEEQMNYLSDLGVGVKITRVWPSGGVDIWETIGEELSAPDPSYELANTGVPFFAIYAAQRALAELVE